LPRIKTLSVIFLAVILLFSHNYQALAFRTRLATKDSSPVTSDRYIREPPLPAATTDLVPEPAAVQEQDTGAVVITPEDVPTVTGTVYLTIDDGPDIITTPLILEILDTYGIKASFFVIGTQAAKYPHLVREMHERGHYVGNHTYSHIYKEIYASKDAFLNSLKANEDLIFELTGTRPRHVRDPGGLLSGQKEIQDYVLSHGYSIMNWNIDSFDSRIPVPSSNKITENVLHQAKQEHLWPEMIILIHEMNTRRNTVQALPAIIESLQAGGFCFEIPIDVITD
jgi:peptidoglycan/xylan/chitin deacetylase (PgdA/CDA1 family)